MTKKVVSFFFGGKQGDTVRFPPRVTPTLVTPLRTMMTLNMYGINRPAPMPAVYLQRQQHIDVFFIAGIVVVRPPDVSREGEGLKFYP